MQPRTKTDQLICEVYAEFLTDALNTCLDRLESRVSLPRHAWTLVCRRRADQDQERTVSTYTRVLMEMNLPFETSQLRHASQNDFTIARGCLANAFLESSVQQHRQVA